MAVRVVIVAKLLQIPVQWRQAEGMANLDMRYVGPLGSTLLRECHSFWSDQTVSKKSDSHSFSFSVIEKYIF